MTTKNIKEFLRGFSREALRERGILRGTRNLLQGKSVESLVRLMRESRVRRLEYQGIKNGTAWYLDVDRCFGNPFSPKLKVGKTDELQTLGHVFTGTNIHINPHFHVDVKNVTKIVQLLRDRGEDALAQDQRPVDYTGGNNQANALLNDIQRYPHAFVIACLMDRQWRAEDCWLVAFKFRERLGSFRFHDLQALQPEQVQRIFAQRPPLHRLTNIMADVFYKAIQMIRARYEGDASRIWRGTPSSAAIVRRFLEFRGAGLKIATMAANILVRDLKVCVSDKSSIDVSPDKLARRVSERLGIVRQGASEHEFLYTWRAWNPAYPGVFDLPLWEIGQKWCRPRHPLCNDCRMRKYCPSIGPV